jgi:hypothetical protein
MLLAVICKTKSHSGRSQNKTRQEKYVWRNTEALSCNHCCCWKAIIVTYSDCVCSLSYPACKAHASHQEPVWLYHIFPLLCHKWHNLGKRFERKMCDVIFSTTFSEILLILRRIQQDLITNVHTSSCIVPVSLVMYWLNFNCFDIKKKLKYQIL